ncbi:MAG TPA: alcohol dehydrogenase catalytic domain-containing protein [Microbacterium sp.]|nr:alcohol dehydrogenase catalytic domain-containing protein [Microbacterium sp.]
MSDSRTDGATMLAVRWHARGDIRLERVARPAAPAPDRVVVQVEAAGICGTDIEEWQHGPINVAVTPHPLTGASAPLVLGHEFCGTVVAAGAESGWQPGQRVAVEVNTSCGRCARCQSGETQQCAQLASLGLHDDGGLAEYVSVPGATCLEIAGDVPAEVAVLAEPLAVGVRALRRTSVTAGERVAVLGGGAVGQLVARLARARGTDVTLIEPMAARREVAERSGITAVHPDALAEAVAATPDGAGFDVVLECAGFDGAVRTSADIARSGGRVAVLGVSTSAIDVTPWDLIARELTVQGVLSHTLADFAEALDALTSGLVDPAGIVSNVVPLSEAIEGAFEPLRDPGAHLKIIITSGFTGQANIG